MIIIGEVGDMDAALWGILLFTIVPFIVVLAILTILGSENIILNVASTALGAGLITGSFYLSYGYYVDEDPSLELTGAIFAGLIVAGYFLTRPFVVSYFISFFKFLLRIIGYRPKEQTEEVAPLVTHRKGWQRAGTNTSTGHQTEAAAEAIRHVLDVYMKENLCSVLVRNNAREVHVVAPGGGTMLSMKNVSAKATSTSPVFDLLDHDGSVLAARQPPAQLAKTVRKIISKRLGR